MTDPCPRPQYLKGSAIGCGLSGLLIPISLILHFAYGADNKRKDREFGTALQDQGPIDVSAIGDDHRQFRLMT